jgi:hypothetical protein
MVLVGWLGKIETQFDRDVLGELPAHAENEHGEKTKRTNGTDKNYPQCGE